ncbi:MAG: TonB-dependent siderophore receptor [Verrucomicrobiales bacterium]|nr:TonB-dependent siderophore receptor [Verrucomicrobiales bacterium]
MLNLINDREEAEGSSLLTRRCGSPALAFLTTLSAAALCPYASSGQGTSSLVGSRPASGTATGTNGPSVLPEVVVKGEQDPGYKPESVASPKIVTALRDTPQTVNVVPRQVIEDQNATTLRDVLRNVPGISFQAGEGGVPAGDQLTIRGFAARTDLFVDGVRDVGGYTRDAFNVEQVEIFKGPNSTYSGRGSTGGSVNMVAKTPKLNPFYGGSLSYGSDDYYRGTLDFNQPIPQLSKLGLEGAAFRLNGLYHDQDFAGRDWIHDHRWALNPTLALGLGTRTRAVLSYLHLQENNLAGYGLPFVSSRNNPYGGRSAVGRIAPLPYDSFLGLVDRDFEDLVNDIAGLRFEHDFTDTVKLQNQTRYGRTDRDSVITAPRIIRNPTADPLYGPYDLGSGRVVTGSDGALYGLNHEFQSRDQVTDVFSNQTDLRTEFETGKLGHTLVTSFEYSHETEANYLRSSTVGTAFPYPAQLSNPLSPSSSDLFHPYFRTGARNQAIVDAAGLSVFDTIELSEKWLFTAGLRGDVFSTTYHQRATNGVTTTLARTDIEPTWRSGLVYKPLPHGSVYFGYGTSFNPSAEGLTLAANNAILDPELGRSYELGTKWDLFRERLSVSAAVFRTDKDNYRNTDPITSVVSTTGKVRVQGIELGVSGRVTERWSIYGGYAFMDSEILKSSTVTTYDGVAIREQGHRLNNTPEQTASISTTYELPWRFTLGTGVFFVDERFSHNVEKQSVAGYWLQDGFVSWKANDHIDIRVNVSNLWDKEYIDRVGGGHAIPGAGRSAILTASFKF